MQINYNDPEMKRVKMTAEQMQNIGIDFSYYTAREVDQYKGRLAKAIEEKALSTEDLLKDPAAQEVLMNFVEDRLKTNKKKYDIAGISHRLAVVELDKYVNNTNYKLSYPVVHVYDVHNLKETIFFSKDESGSVVTVTVPIREGKIVLG